MDTKNDGGAAFPHSEFKTPRGSAGGEMNWDAEAGLTKRDYFAAAALTGLLASGPHDCKVSELVIDAMAYADAMIKARGE